MKIPILSSYRVKLLLLSLMHFATDGLCAYLVFTRLYPDNPSLSVAVFLGYNTLAFVTQSPVGILIDKYNRPKLMLAVSVALLVLGYVFGGVCLVAVTFIGMGNSLFHVAGGKYVTSKSGNDISDLGIFVSTGAIGLVLGQRYFHLGALIYVLFGTLIISLALILLSEDAEDTEYFEEYKGSNDGRKIALLAVLGVVFIRSFIGKAMSFDFDITEHIFLIIALATALGKAVGGIFAKHFGINITTLVSMSVAAVCLTLGNGYSISFVIGVFAFNFSMPITLYYANILLKGKEGFAFGTLAAFLAPAYFLAMFVTYTPVLQVLTALLCLASVGVIYSVSRRISNAPKPGNNDDNT